MRLLVLPALALALMAAAPPQQGLVIAVPDQNGFGLGTRQPRPAPTTTGLQPAPLPNREVDGPTRDRAGTDPSVAPSLLQRSDTYRGEGFSRGSTAQAEQEKKFKPGAGISLRMPFAPN